MKKKWLARCFQWKVNILAALLVAVALVLTLSRVLVIVLAHHPVFIEKWAGTALNRSVKIQSIQADWAVLDPGITFKKVLVKNVDQQSFVQIKRLTLSISILRSLLHWKLLPGRLTIEGVNLDVNNETSGLQVRGIISSSESLQLSGHATAFTNLVNWVLAEGNVNIKGVNVSYHSKNRETYFLHNAHIRVKNNFFTHRVYGGVTINKVSPTEIRFAAKLSDIDFSDAKFNANIYVQLHGIQLDQWANSVWLKPYIKTAAVKAGNADLELWADWHKTRIADLEGRWHLKNVETTVLPTNLGLDINDMLADFIWTPSNDAIDLNVKYIIFSLPNEYRLPLLMKDLKIQLSWGKDDAGLHLYVPNYQFHMLGLEANGGFYLTLPSSGTPTIDFLSSYRFPHFSQLPQLFPDRDRRSSLNQWLHQAFLKGGIQNATIAYRGPIETHPFQNHEAHLSAEFQVRDLSLSYYSDWPVLSALNADVEVSNRQIKATFLNANLDNNPIEKLQASVDDFLQPTLSLVGVLHSNITNVYKFMQDSPIASKKAPSLLPIKGGFDLNMRLTIDFSKSAFPIQSEGEAEAMGSLLKFNVHTTDSIVHIGLNGNLNFTPFAKQLSVDQFKGISGSTHYQASADIYKSKKHSKKLNITFTTDMRGVTISKLPKFIDKKSEAPNPVKLQITDYWKKPMEITLHYRDDIFIRLFANNKHHHIKLLSGEIYVGRKPSPDDSVFPGFVIYGKMDYFNWGAWEPFIMPFIHEENGAIDIPEIFGLPLRYVELQFKQLEAYHQSISDMHFKLIPRDHDWMFQMESPEVVGTFFIPNYSGGTWAGHLDHLFIPKIEAKKSKKKREPLSVDPRTIPPIDIEIKQLKYGKADYGHFQLRTRPTKRGISINTFLINSPLFMLKMKGEWNRHRRHQSTALSGYFQTKDLGQLLLSWDIKNTLLRGRGIAKFQLSWAGALDQMKSEILNGKIAFNFRHGRILKMDESKSTELSLGRILNAFSLEELPRRLTFHFGDITAKGLEFRTLKGGLNIHNGICKLKKTVLDSPVAKLKISGIINFPGKYYDLNVSVAPYVTSSLPLIVGIAGGPIAGVIAWVANKIAMPEIGKMFGFVYHTKGSWDKSKDQKLPLPATTHISYIEKKS